MTTKRSSSAVRDLRAKFENQEANAEAQTWTSRGRQSSTESGSRRRIRASFVSVERPGDMDTNNTDISSRAIDENDSESNGNQADATTKAVDVVEAINTSSESGKAQENGVATHATQEEPAVSQAPGSSLPESTPNKPEAVEPKSETPKKLDNAVESNKEIPAANPDKPVSAVEEEPGALKPAEPTGTSTSTVPAKVPILETKTVAKKASKSSLPNGGTNATTKVASPEARAGKHATPTKAKAPTSKPSLNFRDGKTLNSPAAKLASPKSPARPTTSDSKNSEGSHKLGTPTKQPARTGRTSLSAPTASSAAKTKSSAPASVGSEALKPSTLDKGAATKPKPRSPTRPVKLPSHLTAPTASSAAKHENTKPPAGGAKLSASTSRSSLGDVKPATNAGKTGLTRSKSTVTKPAPRSSNAKPVHADEGFLARMMRPTASSASKTHEKTDSKPAPTKTTTTLPIRPRPAADGKAKAPAKVEKAADKAPHENGIEKSEGEPSTPASTKQAEPDTAPAESTPAQEESTIVDASLAGIQTPAGEGPTIR